jgi:hypothetical protein
MGNKKKVSGITDEDKDDARAFLIKVLVDEDMSEEDKRAANEVAETIMDEADRLFTQFPLMARLLMSLFSSMEMHDQKLDLLRGYALVHEEKLDTLKDLMVDSGLVQLADLNKKPIDKTLLN